MTIAPATDAEREWCARLMAGTDPWKRFGRDLKDLRGRCRHPEYLLFVGHAEDSSPLGFVLLHPRGLAGSPYLVSVAVAPEARGRGVGTELIRFVEEYFRPTAHHLFLCVSSFNTEAQRLYARLGFAVAGEFKDYIIEGASEILMHKRL